jgi:hypothetical protein
VETGLNWLRRGSRNDCCKHGTGNEPVAFTEVANSECPAGKLLDSRELSS